MPSEHGTALVTGGGRGIGAGIARELAADGWSVVVAARSRDEINSVAEEIDGRAIAKVRNGADDGGGQRSGRKVGGAPSSGVGPSPRVDDFESCPCNLGR